MRGAMAVLMLAAMPSAAARPRPAAPATVLIGQHWLGLWRDGRVVATRPLDGWVLGASRVSSRTIELAAQRADATESGDTLLRFDARTLAPLARGHDPALASATVRVPIGLDPGVPDDSARLPPGLAGRVAPPPRRVVVSPDGSVVAVFARPRGAASVWRGRAVDARGGRELAATGLAIDDGTTRENGAAQRVACLLPRGEGVIYTYIGAPADRVSAFQRFGTRGAAAVELTTPYVMSCLAPRP